MSLFLATLLPGLFVALLGGILLANNSLVASTAKSLPRSNRAAWLFFGAGALWFVWRCSHANESDLIFFKTPTPVMVAFAVLAVLSFIYTPDFLAVRGLCILMLLVAEPFLYAGFMDYRWQVYPYKIAVYAGISLALYLAAAPYRLRDIFEWLFQRPSRPRLVGAILLSYGLATAAAAFTY